MTLREAGRKTLPWALTLCGAALYAYFLVGGGAGYSTEARAMPPLDAARLDTGQVVSNQTLQGHPVILNVWAPSCAPCRHEMPSLDRVAGDYAGRVEVLGLMAWGNADEGRAIQHSSDLKHLPLLAGGSAFLNALDVDSVPTTFFIRPDGTIAARQVGMRGEGFFRDQADKLLAGKL